ncbi:hypothetical protein CMV_020120, partial [Castanea mollissima]
NEPLLTDSLLSEEVLDFFRGEMTQQKIKDLKQSLNWLMQINHWLCFVEYISLSCSIFALTSMAKQLSVIVPDVVANSGRTIVCESFHIAGGTFFVICPKIVCLTSRVHGTV